MLHMYDGILFTYCEGKYLILLFFFFFFGIFRHLRGRQWLFTWAEFHRSDWQLLWQQWHRLEIMSRHAGLPIVCGFLLEYFESENRVRRHAQLHQTQRNAHRQAWLVYSFFFVNRLISSSYQSTVKKLLSPTALRESWSVTSWQIALLNLL